MRRKPKTGWTVVVCQATKLERDYGDYQPKKRKVDNEVAVRICKDGKPRVTFGVLHITDKDFEDRITTMKAAALERAAALEAVGAE